MTVEVKPKLNKLLKERNMTQNDLSAITGITQPVISRFDKNTQHRSIHLYLISNALGLKMDDLFEIYESEKRISNE